MRFRPNLPEQVRTAADGGAGPGAEAAPRVGLADRRVLRGRRGRAAAIDVDGVGPRFVALLPGVHFAVHSRAGRTGASRLGRHQIEPVAHRPRQRRDAGHRRSRHGLKKHSQLAHQRRAVR